MVGRTIGHYEILAKVGEGGMGVVYRARDNHLGRTVAVKVLSARSMANEERKRRFITEAKLASSLNHPNIVTIHDIGADGGVDYIAMEYIAGRTLDQLIPRRGMRITEALRIAIQITDALARSHAEGIVHRDLKPTNVMVTDDGLVKVLDFGLAKLTEAAPADAAETLPLKPCTEEGTILGTVAYMSPEQAEGKPVDPRSDVFAFGSLLYEMISGHRAFQGETRLSILSAILRIEPRPVREVAFDVPAEVERIITHCLRKDPAKRFQHMVDVKTLLEEIKEESDSGRLKAGKVAGHPLRRIAWPLLAALLLATLASLVFLLVSSKKGAPSPGLGDRLVRFTWDTGLYTQPALSPDGKLVAYASDRAGNSNLDIWIQSVTGGDPHQLTFGPGDECQPSFNPDGTYVLYTALGENPGVYTVPHLGGNTRLIGRGGMWPSYSPDGRYIAYSVGQRWWHSKIYVADVRQEPIEPRELKVDVPWAFGPVWSPDGRRLLFEGSIDEAPSVTEQTDWWTAPMEGGHASQTGLRPYLLSFGIRPARDMNPGIDNRFLWQPDAAIFAAGRAGTTNLWKLPLNPRTAEADGEPSAVTSGANTDFHPFLTNSGRLAFSNAMIMRDIWRLPLDANRGKVRGPLEKLADSRPESKNPRISPDGKKLLYISRTRARIRDLVSGQDSLLTGPSGPDDVAVFSPDGSKVAFCRGPSANCDLNTISVSDRSERKLCAGVRTLVGWINNGKQLVFIPSSSPVIRSIDIETREVADVVRHPHFPIKYGSVSPDGQWISIHLAVAEDNMPVYIASFKDGVASGEESWILVADGPHAGSWWSPDGSLLYFLSRRDGSACIWAQRLHPVQKRPVGEPFAVQHLHGRRHVAGDPSFGSAITADALYCGLREVTSSIWLSRPE